MKTRATLKNYFKKGAIPTESNFADLIDSVVVQDEDNLIAQPGDAPGIRATGGEESLIDFYRAEGNKDKLTWQIKQKPANRAGLGFGESGKTHLFIQEGKGSVGIGITTPTATLHVNGSIKGISLDVRSTKGATRLLVDDKTGKVGIGVASPKSMLEVDGNIHGKSLSVSDDITARNLTATGDIKGKSLDVNGEIKSKGLDVLSTKGGAGLFVDPKTGNVGVRMTTAKHPLNLPNEAHFSFGDHLYISGRGGTGSITANAFYQSKKWTISNKKAKSAFIGIRSTGIIDMSVTVANGSTSWKPMLRLDGPGDKVYFGTGKVGIGVENPTSKLQVDGTIHGTALSSSGVITGDSLNVTNGNCSKNLVVLGTIKGKMWLSDEYTWKEGDKDIKMRNSEKCIAVITYIAGDFNGKGERAQVYISKTNNYWYLKGTGKGKGIEIRARCFGRP